MDSENVELLPCWKGLRIKWFQLLPNIGIKKIGLECPCDSNTREMENKGKVCQRSFG